MRRSSLAAKIEEQALALHRKRLLCSLLRKEGLLSGNTDLVLRFAEHLLISYSFRPSKHE